MALSNLAVKNAKPEAKAKKVSDERGLYLLVTPTGSKLWQFKYRIHGKEKKLSFGAYPDVSLSQARELRDGARKLVAQGIDPVQQKREDAIAAKHAQANTFSAIASEYLEKCRRDGLASSTLNKGRWFLRLLEP